MRDSILCQWTDEDFSVSRMVEKLRKRKLPPGYLEAYSEYLHRTHARLAEGIEADLAKSDPNGTWTF